MLGKFYADTLEHDIRLKLGLPSLGEVRRKRLEKQKRDEEV